MKLRVLIALAVVLTLLFGASMLASADDTPNCWWVGYTVKVMGTKVVKIPNRCVPCLAVCDAFPMPPAKTSL